MRLLVLGGTRFVGRAIVVEAVRQDHEVTTFNRGRTGEDVPGASAVRGDRESFENLEALARQGPWDVVIDTSGYVPAVVGAAAATLSEVAGAYIFVSTVSVYPEWPAAPVSEDSPVYAGDPSVAGTAADEANWSAAQYGAYKRGCEMAVLHKFSGLAIVMRPGVILGPGENVGRLTWWLRRIASGGDVLAPAPPDQFIQPVDVRDLAAFILNLAASPKAGVFNVAAPHGHATFQGMLEGCRQATGSDASIVWAPPDFLTAYEVREWTELPLWRTPAGTWAVNVDRAISVGLHCRPMSETVADTWRWLNALGGPAAYGRQAHHGIDPAKETDLLAELRNHPS